MAALPHDVSRALRLWYTLIMAIGVICSCGVLAVGICPQCNEPYCPQHEAKEWHTFGGQQVLGMCWTCHSGNIKRHEAAQLAQRNTAANKIQAVLDRIDGELARLARDRGQPTVHRLKNDPWKSVTTGLRRRRYVYDIYAPAWPVGDLVWDLYESHTSGGGKKLVPSGLTAKRILVPLTMTGPREEPIQEGFVSNAELDWEIGRSGDATTPGQATHTLDDWDGVFRALARL